MDSRRTKRTAVVGEPVASGSPRRSSPRKQRLFILADQHDDEQGVNVVHQHVYDNEENGKLEQGTCHELIKFEVVVEETVGDDIDVEEYGGESEKVDYMEKVTPVMALAAPRQAHYDDNGHIPYECVECGYTSTDRSSLQRHMQTHRWADHICHMCNEIFDGATSKLAHVCRAELKGRVRCPRCPQMVHNYLQLCGHVESHHNLQCEVNRVLMSSDDEFNDWRTRVQREFGFQWRVQNATADNTRHFICNRSGKGTGRERRTGQRIGWKKGLVRTGETCTSFARVKRYVNGKFCVTYCLTHTHELDPKALRIDSETEETVVKLIIEGHSIHSIVERIRSGMDAPSSGTPSARELIFNEKDVENIAQRRGVKQPLRYACKMQRPYLRRSKASPYSALGASGQRLANATHSIGRIRQDTGDPNEAEAPQLDPMASDLTSQLHRMVNELQHINTQLNGEWMEGTSAYFQAAIENIQHAVNFNDQSLVYESAAGGAPKTEGGEYVTVMDVDGNEEEAIVDENAILEVEHQ